MPAIKVFDRPIAFHRCFVTLTGSVNAALLLSQAVYWSNRTSNPDGWFHKGQEEWEEETGLTRHEQDKARENLRKTGFWNESRKGAPAKLYFQIDSERFDDAIADLDSSLPESGKLNCRKAANKNAGKQQSSLPENGTSDCHKPADKIDDKRQSFLIGTETTSETTTEREEAALSGILPILLEAYKNIAKDRVQQDQLSWQVQQLEADGATVEEIRAWLKSRRSLSSIRFIAEDFRTWKESQRFARQIKNADALVGLNDQPPAVIASITPVEERSARKGAFGQVLEILAESLPEAAILTWFEPLAESRVDDGILHLSAPHESFRSWIENNYADEFYAAIERAGLSGAVIGEEAAEAEEREVA